MDPLEASRLITDEYSAKILVATFKKPKSAIELSREYGIPIAACYRRIHVLEKAGVLSCVERALTQKGKRISLYMSQLRNAYIFFENGKLRVRFQLASGVTQDFGGDWQAIETEKER
ncbi:MAG: helix-turn-helix domain-containing protein [Candidatus Thermoplasmatota archaeon]|nr:helix-turn-helix domain-containing protein [Candidatus Thermoplasmatota archaeon]